MNHWRLIRAKKPEIKVVQLRDLPAITEKLADLIKIARFLPAEIVYIEKAGRIPACLLQAKLGGTIQGVWAIRPGNWLKTLAAPILPLIPAKIRFRLRSAELGTRQDYSERRVIFPQIPSKQGNILVMDDAIDTGYSMLAVVKYLVACGVPRERISIAVYNTTLSTRVLEPDFVCFPETIIFYPWSQDSREKKEYLRIYSLCQVVPINQLFA